MNKRLIFLLIMLLSAGFIFSSSMEAEVVSHPSSATISWKSVDNTVYYDIYKDNEFVVRLDSSHRSYEVEKLNSNTLYNFTIASRDAGNNTLDAAWLKCTTGSWDGTYYWKNQTDNDNKGKMKSLKLRVETVSDSTYGQYYSIYLIQDNGNEFRIFPLFAFPDQSAYEWHKYKEDSVAGNSYRANAEIFNTSSFKPGKWKVYSIVIDSERTTAYIQTSALGMELMTETVFELYEDADGKHLSLNTSSEQDIVDKYLFKNPNPGQGDSFILDKIN